MIFSKSSRLADNINCQWFVVCCPLSSWVTVVSYVDGTAETGNYGTNQKCSPAGLRSFYIEVLLRHRKELSNNPRHFWDLFMIQDQMGYARLKATFLAQTPYNDTPSCLWQSGSCLCSKSLVFWNGHLNGWLLLSSNQSWKVSIMLKIGRVWKYSRPS